MVKDNRKDKDHWIPLLDEVKSTLTLDMIHL